MLVLLDTNVFISALLTGYGPPARIVDEWRDRRFHLLTCQAQIDELRKTSRAPKFSNRLQPHLIGTMVNHLYGAVIWPEPIPRKHEAADPTDSYLLDLIEVAQPDYAVTGDKRAGLLQLDTLGRTKFMTAKAFCERVLGH